MFTVGVKTPKQAQPLQRSPGHNERRRGSMNATANARSRPRIERAIHIGALILVFSLLSAVGAMAQLNVPLTIQEMTYPGASGLGLTNEPVTVGLPLVKGLVACGNA